jgi:ABC-type polysaccharide/polyol phosphate transport system ATPase subunit
MRKAAAVLLVSHAMATVRELAQTAMWLAVMLGDADEVVDAYLVAQHATGSEAGLARSTEATGGC